jgi:outer membrane protein assembly factor BamB
LPPAEVDLLDATSATHLENAKQFLAEKQWAEAVEAIRRAQEADASSLIRVDLATPLAGFERYISVGEYCQWRIAALAMEAPEALADYRRLVDPMAERWFQEAEQDNDEALFRRIVRQAFASRRGDDALLKLGDLAASRGDYASARAFWQRISDSLTVPPAAAGALKAAAGSPLWQSLRRFDFTTHGGDLSRALESPSAVQAGIYPDSDLDRAGVMARLVLASLLENSRERAAVELSVLRLLHPIAEGQLAGGNGRYADLLQRQFNESAEWPAHKTSSDWPTFAGAASRAISVDASLQPLWSFSLPRLAAENEVGAGRRRIAEDAKSLLSYHPIVVNGTVLVRYDASGNSYVAALDLKSGKLLWQVDYGRGAADQADEVEAAGHGQARVGDSHVGLAQHAGVARHTLSATGRDVFARMGSPVTLPTTRRAARWLPKEQGFLLGLDLESQGKPHEGFPLYPPSNDWTFEGSPLADSGTIYVAMRRVEGARSQIYLAAFERQTTAIAEPNVHDESARQTGRLKWRTRICSSLTPGVGEVDGLTHLLVTQHGDRLYLNTNSGAVAALNALDGQLLWLVKYPRIPVRASNADSAGPQQVRDLVPCVVWKDLAIVAPSDCERIFALQAATGELAWALPAGAAQDVVHLLGVSDDVLIASGDYLYWIDVHTGRLLTQFPFGTLGGSEQAAPDPRGLGRGLIASGRIWWPTREALLVFDASPATSEFGRQPRLLRQVDLGSRGVTGGNLLVADGILLIATGDKLVALAQ